MKKILIFALIVSIMLIASVGCNQLTEEVEVNIIMPDGAASLAFAKLLSDNIEFDGYRVNYEIAVPSAGLEAPTIVASKITGKNADIAIMPTNTAANLYNKGIDIKVVANVIWGNLFMISKGDAVSDLNTLKGKVVFNISENGTPDIVFKYILQENNIEYTSEYDVDSNDMPIAVSGKVVLAYKQATEIIPMIKQDKIEYGILGEPAITNALNAIGGNAKVVLDLQEEWQSITGLGDSYAQACLVVSGDFLKSHKAFIDSLIVKLKESEQWLTAVDSSSNPLNIDAAKAAFTAYYSASLLNITIDTVERSNINTVGINESKDAIVSYLTVLNAFNPASIGGSLPNDNFYYSGE